ERSTLEAESGVALPKVEVDSMTLVPTSSQSTPPFDPNEATGEDFQPPMGVISEADTGETGLEDSPTDQGPSEEEITGAMASAIEQPTVPLLLGKILEPELPRREEKRSHTEV